MCVTSTNVPARDPSARERSLAIVESLIIERDTQREIERERHRDNRETEFREIDYERHRER